MRTYDVLSIGGGPAGITIAKILGKNESRDYSSRRSLNDLLCHALCY